MNNPSWCNVLVQVAIAAGESFFPSGREAPSTDLAEWMEGKVFFDQLVEEQRREVALMDGAYEEEMWRAVWGEADRVEE